MPVELAHARRYHRRHRLAPCRCHRRRAGSGRTPCRQSTMRSRRRCRRARRRPVVDRGVTAALPAGEDRPGQREMADAVAAAIDRRAPPRRAGRHRHRQDARLPRARPSCPAAGRGRHRHQGAAGPAGRQGPARSSPSTSTAPFDVRGAEGPVQLPVPASACDEVARRERRPARRSTALRRAASADGASCGWPPGPTTTATGDRAELDVEPSPTGRGRR